MSNFRVMPPTDPTAGEVASLASFLRQERPQILAMWEQRVRSLPAARHLSRAELLDHLPHLLDHIAGMVDDLETGRPVREPGTLSDTHAIERLEEGYDLDEVVREFASLRQCVLELWAGQPHRAKGTPLLNLAIDEAVTNAVDRYMKARERTLVGLDRISSAALASTDVDGVLQALARVLLDTTAAVDSVAIFLCEGGRLVLRAAVGLEAEELAAGLEAELGDATSAGRIAAQAAPLELHEIARAPATSDALTRWGAKALYGVRMLREERLVGVAQMASRTAAEFSNEDKLLFRAMVERATLALTQQQLRAALDDEHAALQVERRRLQAVLAVLPVGVWVAARDGRITHVNAAVRELWGDIPDIDGVERYSAFRGWRVPDGRPVTADDWALARALRRRETSRDEEIEIQASDGVRRTILNSAAPIVSDAGELLGGVAVNVDITARKRIEADERKARADAERSLAMLDALFDGAPVGFAFFDREFRCVRLNGTLAAMTGRPAAEHVGRTVAELLPEVREALEPMLRRVIESGEGVRAVEFASATPARPDELRDWVMDAYPVRLPDGTVGGVGLSIVEVTALKRALRARDEFIAVASHDLRSPLTSLKLQLQTLTRRAGAAGVRELPTEWLQPRLDRMTRQLERVGTLLDDLLDVSRLQAGRLALVVEEVDLAALVREVAAQHLELLAGSGCELRLDARGPLVGRWDPLRLEQVVSNLITNAAKYGSGRPVEIRVAAVESNAVLSVRDHGVGIAPEDQPRIFEQFSRVGDRGAFTGTGLGLWIVNRIVTALGGRIRVDSTPGEGSTFTVELPRGPGR